MPRFSLSHTFLFFTLLFLLSKASPPGKVNLNLYTEEDYSPAQTRILASAEKQKIRIAAFYFLDEAPAGTRKLLKEQVIPGAIAYFQAALKAIPSPEPLSWTDSKIQKCADDDIDIPQALIDGVNADLVLLFTGDNLPDSTHVAVASSCSSEKGFGRPNFGRIQYNYKYVGSDDEPYQDRIYLTYLTLHEMGHILGFSNSLFDNYYNPETGQAFNPVKEKRVNGQTITVLDVEPLTKRLRKYFDCSSVEGAYLENEGAGGSQGSHFERRIFLNDVLTGSTLSDTRISEFFLAVLEGSGWYSVDYEMAEPFTWGKGLGCDFLDSKCVKKDKTSAFPNSFCMPLESYGCNYDQSGYGVCGNFQEEEDKDLPSAFNYYGGNRIVSDKFADNCPYNYLDKRYKCQDSTNVPVFSTEEYFGSGSSCFSGNIYGTSQEVPYCFKRTCLEIASNKYQVIVEIGDTNVICTKKGSVSVPGYSGKLNCPDPTPYCKLTEVKYCPRGCMGRGECINKKCRCYDGYSGSDCGTRASYTMKEGTLDYLENFPGFTRTPHEDKSKIKISLRIMSVIIGVAIIGITVVVGLTVNKIRDLHLKSEARKISKVEYKISHVAPEHVYQFPSSDGMSPKATSLQNIQMGVIEEAQPPTNTAAIRQEALRDYFAPPADQVTVDKLAVLRGQK